MATNPPTAQLDTSELEQRVKHMYEEVALEPEREFHFETGRPLAERLGYPADQLDRIPAAAIDSFAGVGHFLDLAALQPGETVLDLGSGSGMDSFLAANQVGPAGRAIGVDMTAAQLAKARRLAEEGVLEDVLNALEELTEEDPMGFVAFRSAVRQALQASSPIATSQAGRPGRGGWRAASRFSRTVRSAKMRRSSGT